MKKLLALALAVMLLCSAALADVLNFGDFNMDLDPTTPGSVGEKIDSEVFLALYYDYNEEAPFHANINVVWQEIVGDLTAVDPDAYADQVLSGVVATLENMGMVAANPTLLGAALDELQGVPALFLMYTVDADFSPLGLDYQCVLYYTQAIVSVDGVGSYTFTVTTDDPDQVVPMCEMLDTVTWNF